MNLIEFPFGPISNTGRKTYESEQDVFDRQLKRRVKRKMLITGSDAFGLPRPIDEQVLIGMQGLTHEAGFEARRVEFSRYHLCRVLGWNVDGRAYKRLEDSFDRLAGTTLKFKDAWWDKGDSEWKSKTFHLIDEAELCSKDRFEKVRANTGRAAQSLCYFVWSDVLWKSMQDGFIKKIDMVMFRKIARGRRKEVAVRLYRLLGKRLYKKSVVFLNLRRLSLEKLGLCESYRPSEMRRIVERAGKWLVDCDYLREFSFLSDGRVQFIRQVRSTEKRGRQVVSSRQSDRVEANASGESDWMSGFSEEELLKFEKEALSENYGSDFERRIVWDQRKEGRKIGESRFVRRDFIRKYVEQKKNVTGLVLAR